MAGVVLPERKWSRELESALTRPSLRGVSPIVPEMFGCALPLATSYGGNQQFWSRPLTEENLPRESSVSNSRSNNRSVLRVPHLRTLGHLFLTRANSSVKARLA